MLRNLLWKEWQEQRSVVWAGLCLSLVLPFLVFSSVDLVGYGDDPVVFAQLLALVSGMFAWPLFATLAAASAHAERDPSAMDFLLTRPASLSLVWAAKVAAATSALAVILAVSFGVAQVAHHRFLDRWLAFPYFPGSGLTIPSATAAAIVAAGTLLVFACTLLCAFLMRHQVAAAALGLTLAMSIVYLGFLVMQSIAAEPRLSTGSGTFMLGFLASASVGVLAGAHLSFRGRADRSGPGRARRHSANSKTPFMNSFGGTAQAS